MSEETIFSKIISREIPAEIIYENDAVLAFLSISPNNPGHTLVIPKEYSRNIYDISASSWSNVMEAVRILAPKITKAMGAEGFNIKMNNEAVGGQEVFHTHVHIIPRHRDDGLTYWPEGSYQDGEKAEVGEKIRAELAKS